MTTANDRLKMVREQRGYDTAVSAARAMGRNETTYIQHENGTRGSGSLPKDAARDYAAFFRVSLDWLVSGKGDEPQPDNDPNVEDLERMMREVMDAEVTLQTRLADLPRIFAPALHEQLKRFRSDRGSR